MSAFVIAEHMLKCQRQLGRRPGKGVNNPISFFLSFIHPLVSSQAVCEERGLGLQLTGKPVLVECHGCRGPLAPLIPGLTWSAVGLVTGFSHREVKTRTVFQTPHRLHRAVPLRYWQSDNRTSTAVLPHLRATQKGNLARPHSRSPQALRKPEGPAMHCHLHRGDWSFHPTNEKKKPEPFILQ